MIAHQVTAIGVGNCGHRFRAYVEQTLPELSIWTYFGRNFGGGKIGECPMDSWENRRQFKRKYMLFKIPAYDAQTRRFLGLVQDITEGGIQLFGVKVEADSTKTLVIQASDYIKSSPLYLEVVCRWTRKENPQGYYVSGFEILRISEEARRNLMKLIDFVTLG